MEHKYKEGDIVILISIDNNNISRGIVTSEIGKLFKISAINARGYVVAGLNHLANWSVAEHDLTLVSEETPANVTKLIEEAEAKRQEAIIKAEEERLRIEEERKAKAIKWFDDIKPVVEQVSAIFKDVVGEDRFEVRLDLYANKPEEFEHLLTKRPEERYFNVIVHYPELTITNTLNIIHKITDLFCVYYFNQYGTFYTSPRVFRTTITLDEVIANYSFSHASRGAYYCIDPSGLCLGSTVLSDMVDKMRCTNTFNEESLAIILYQFEDYFRWESLEGGPYIKLSEIGAASEQLNSVSNDDLVTSKNAFLQKFDEFPITFNKLNKWGEFIVEHTPEFEDLVTQIATIKVNKIPTTGRYVSNQNLNRAKILEDKIYVYRGIEVFKFKNKEFPFTIYDNYNPEEQSKFPEVAHPEITKYILEELNKEINAFQFAKLEI
jgi:hypothetical protein